LKTYFPFNFGTGKRFFFFFFFFKIRNEGFQDLSPGLLKLRDDLYSKEKKNGGTDHFHFIISKSNTLFNHAPSPLCRCQGPTIKSAGGAFCLPRYFFYQSYHPIASALGAHTRRPFSLNRVLVTLYILICALWPAPYYSVIFQKKNGRDPVSDC